MEVKCRNQTHCLGAWRASSPPRAWPGCASWALSCRDHPAIWPWACSSSPLPTSHTPARPLPTGQHGHLPRPGLLRKASLRPDPNFEAPLSLRGPCQACVTCVLQPSLSFQFRASSQSQELVFREPPRDRQRTQNKAQVAGQGTIQSPSITSQNEALIQTCAFPAHRWPSTSLLPLVFI